MLCTTVIPTIGRQSLDRAVTSALSQNLDVSEHEIIVVNDSGRALDQRTVLSDRKVRMITTNRCGEAVACNVGAALATGSYITFVHDDDYLLPGALKALIEVADNTQSAWVIGAYDVVDEEDTHLFTISPQFPSNPFGILVTGECLHIGASLLRRNVFFEVGGFDLCLGSLVDRDLQTRVAAKHEFGTTETVVACIRASQSSQSSYRGKDISTASRIIREKAFNIPQATQRIISSVGKNPFMRGRIFRNYVFSAVLNIVAKQTWIAMSRFTNALRIGSYYVLTPNFWRGAIYGVKFDNSGRRLT